ncbi:MAG: DUF1015 domain-containing protein [Ruminococcus sp.]|jgi:uncharacterized protein (DUF1015 family)|nr:DUF1015 domain-containing protein [Ruminococcus sp.]
MATVKAFNGTRFSKEAGDLNKLVSPPYDIVSDKEYDTLVALSDKNIIRLELPKGGDDRYKKAGELFSEWKSDGTLFAEAAPAYYIYEMVFTANGVKNSLKGFVGLVKLQDFSDGVVLPHEETLSKAKTDRFNLMSETMCNFSQIYSLYMDENGECLKSIESVSSGAPTMSVTDNDGTIHRMWAVTDETFIKNLSAAFEAKKLYIADGHHRYETALNFEKKLQADGKATANSGYISMMLVNIENPGLVIFPTHRIVKNLEGFSAEELIKKSAEYFDITEAANEDEMNAKLHSLYDNGKKAFALYSGSGKCNVFRLKNEAAVKDILPDMSDAYCGLDVSVLHTLVLEKLLGIDKENMANQKNLTYTRSAKEALEAVDFGGADCAFILNPTKVSEIRDVAAAGEKMPQKSTYFYPKLITGLVINDFA